MENKKETNNLSSFFNKKTALKIFISFLTSILLFFFIFKYISFAKIITSFQQISIFVILLSCFLLLINYFFRMLRTHILFSEKVGFFDLYIITIIHTTLVQLLPFRLGEISFLYLSTKTKKIDMMNAGTSLISIHLLDVIIIISAFFTSFFLLGDSIALSFPKILLLFIFIFIFITILSLFLMQRKQLLLAEYLSKNKEKKTILLFFLRKINQVTLFLHSFHSKKKLLLLLFYSFCVWTSYYALMYFLYLFYGISFSHINFLFIISSALLFALIPIQGIAGFGNVEISWSALLILFGIDNILALETTIQVHIIGLIASVIVGLIGLLFYFFCQEKKQIKNKFIQNQ